MMIGRMAPAPMGEDAGVPSALGADIGPSCNSQCMTKTTM